MSAPEARRITSRDNAWFKRLVRLSGSSRERRKTGLTLLDGAHLVEAARRRGQALETLVVSDSGLLRAEHVALLASFATLPQVVLPDALFAEAAPVDSPSGLMAVMAVPGRTAAFDPHADCVLLEGIQDEGNLGTLLRTAAAAGVGQVCLSRGCCRAWSPRVLRAGMGAHFRLAIHEDAELDTVVARFGGVSVATEGEASLSLYALDLRGIPVAWLFGGEGAGLSDALAASARHRVSIPMPGGEESLNVAAAAAVCLFEALRQRSEGQGGGRSADVSPPV